MIVPSHEIGHRDEFADLLNLKGLRTVAIEVGIDQAVFAEEFLRRWRGKHWFGVDPFEPYEGCPWDRQADFISAVHRLHQFNGRARIIKATSLDAAKMFASGTIWNMPLRPCFVYLDDNHGFEAVKAGIKAWWPLIAEGGIIAGHDYDDSHPGVIRAVGQFAEDRDVFLTHERPGHEGLPSWFCFKGTEG